MGLNRSQTDVAVEQDLSTSTLQVAPKKALAAEPKHNGFQATTVPTGAR